MIGVKNNGKDKLKARYDGQDHVFEPGVTTALSEDAAKHIFGYGERDKTRALLRLGWLPNGAAVEEGLARLDNFAFLAVEEVKFKEEDEPTQLPRTVAEPKDPLLAEAEAVHAEKMSKPEGNSKQFAKK